MKTQIDSSSKMMLAGMRRICATECTPISKRLTINSISSQKADTQSAPQSIVYGFAQSPWGCCFIADSDKGICKFDFYGHDDLQHALECLRAQWPKAEYKRSDDVAAEVLRKVLTLHKDDGEQLTLLVKGTDFQINVWKTLLSVPFASVISYGELAQAAGSPAAVRAVASAVGRNPLSYIVPCHRVIRNEGVAGQYMWGTQLKYEILDWEQSTLKATL